MDEYADLIQRMGELSLALVKELNEELNEKDETIRRLTDELRQAYDTTSV